MVNGFKLKADLETGFLEDYHDSIDERAGILAPLDSLPASLIPGLLHILRSASM